MIDIRIMASYKRQDNVYRILKKLELPESIVVWDDRPDGGDAMYTAMKAWSLPLKDNITHRLVLQDDVDICENFVEHATTIGNRHKTHAVTLFSFISPLIKRETPYYRVNYMSGCAIMLPRNVIYPCMSWCASLPEDNLYKYHDDLAITEYCRKNHILMVATIPNIVQHLDGESLLPATYNWKRISKTYDSNPDVDWNIHSVQRCC